MPETGPVVADSGPLIALATVRQMDLVGRLYGSVLVPGAVLREVTSFGSNRPGAAELAAAAWAVRIELAPPAVRRGARLLLLDDRRARRIAEVAYGLRVKGAAGLLVAAKKQGFITSVRPLLDEMRASGYYLAEVVTDRALREAGER